METNANVVNNTYKNLILHILIAPTLYGVKNVFIPESPASNVNYHAAGISRFIAKP
jgi:hypothetical protein